MDVLVRLGQAAKNRESRHGWKSQVDDDYSFLVIMMMVVVMMMMMMMIVMMMMPMMMMMMMMMMGSDHFSAVTFVSSDRSSHNDDVPV